MDDLVLELAGVSTFSSSLKEYSMGCVRRSPVSLWSNTLMICCFTRAALAGVFIGALALYQCFDCHLFLLSFLAGGLFRTLTASLWPRAPRFALIPAGARKDGGKRVGQKEFAGVPGHVPLQPDNDYIRCSDTPE
jgi:hypothetical protein